MKTSVVSFSDLFGHLLVNGTETEKWKYVRYLTMTPEYAEMYPPDNEWAKCAPVQDLAAIDLRCNHEAQLFAHNTSTATVIAGEEIGFRIVRDFSPDLTIFHAGPGQVYLSKADDLSTYEGDGDWFKIASAGPINDTQWELIGGIDMNFTIPLTTPPGTYLMRMEHIMPMDARFSPQFYISCAHINVVGPGGGNPTELARFPGSYKREDPGLLLNSQFEDLDKYVAPGPSVWKG
ncbi:glycosyl hydrolase family 61-domain-containing protein [Nemania sp. FL0916]|nr:glycosyl hydrolase family 61-domain-containing protein [Nemania sp. FL0916]